MFPFHSFNEKASNLSSAHIDIEIEIDISYICFSIELLIIFYIKELSNLSKRTLDL